MSKSKLKKKKICLIASSLGKGGAERATANQAVIFEQLNFEVHIVIILDDISYAVNATILNLGKIKAENKYGFGKIKSLMRLNSFLKAHDFDFIVDNRCRNSAFKEIIYKSMIFNGQKMIYVIHHFDKKIVFTSKKYVDKWLYKKSNLIAVSKAIENDVKLYYGFNIVNTIYNSFDFKQIAKRAQEKRKDLSKGDYIIFYGRLDDKSKNLKLLLNAFSLSKLKNDNVKLLVLGNGPDKEDIMNYSVSKKLTGNVIFESFISNPFPYVKDSKFMVLSSRFEGFPMVIPETLSLGVPVISVDCKSGPNEVIKNEYNGLLIINNDAKRLAKAMDKLYYDKELYIYCKKNAKNSVAFLDIKNQLDVWNKYFREIENNN